MKIGNEKIIIKRENIISKNLLLVVYKNLLFFALNLLIGEIIRLIF